MEINPCVVHSFNFDLFRLNYTLTQNSQYVFLYFLLKTFCFCGASANCGLEVEGFSTRDDGGLSIILGDSAHGFALHVVQTEPKYGTTYPSTPRLIWTKKKKNKNEPHKDGIHVLVQFTTTDDLRWNMHQTRASPCSADKNKLVGIRHALKTTLKCLAKASYALQSTYNINFYKIRFIWIMFFNSLCPMAALCFSDERIVLQAHPKHRKWRL